MKWAETLKRFEVTFVVIWRFINKTGWNLCSEGPNSLVLYELLYSVFYRQPEEEL